LEHANHYLRAGAERVVFGTAAVKNLPLIAEALAMDVGAVVVAIDVRDGIVKTEGWLEDSGRTAIELAQAMESLGVVRVLYTEISREGMLSEPDYQGLSRLKAATGMGVIASGGISSTEQLVRVAGLGLEAAIVGRALYTGAIDLP